ncbi:hypothetical protein SAMN02745823_02693 [Sporobacter termitidis DSM 10068]|uniref:DUF4358 domain-containing protein n=1 Tax=Sporobacter termitidis DSM 10068 TaxID=1123282 RepID=A0A1M5YNF5_9FIRM|nr:hypothetical protein [Sporobacter termitidis]SHI13448.1 hypothetical protein SAMN02745823_02693 [Sporobacter termitidis DSM 10068]
MLKKTIPVFALILTLTLFSSCASETPQTSPSPDASVPADTSADASPDEGGNAGAGASADNGGVPARGVWSNGVYSSVFTGLKFTLPDGWEVSPDEEVAEKMSIAADTLSDKTKWAAAASGLSTIYDMMASDPTTGSNVIVMFENADGMASVSESDYLLAAAMALDPEDYTIDDTYTTKVGATDYKTLHVFEKYIEYDQYFFVHRQGNYMTSFVVTILDDTKIEDFLTHFA